MVKEIKGDIFDSKCDMIIHGCNCIGGFGAGIALSIAKKYPLAKTAYFNKFKNTGWHLGEIQVVDCEDRKIINAATQFNYGSPKSGEVYADYPAIKKCFKLAKQYAKAHGLSIATPKIGAGLAGGNWEIIKKIIEDEFSDYEISIYYYNKNEKR